MKHHIDDNVLNEQLKTHLRALKMPGLSRKLDEVVRHAEAERAGYRQFLVDALSTERLSREDSAINTRIREAGFPEHKTLAEFDFKASDGVDPAVVGQLATGVFVDNAENLALIGPVGTGKTHLGIAIGIEMCRRRKHVRFVRAADLVRQLLEARDQRELGRLTQRLQRADLLIVDELGFVPFDRQGGEVLFNLLSQRHLRRSVLVTSNLAFSEWPLVFGGDEKLAAALLDRMAETATVITTRGKSFRMRRRANAGRAA